MQPNHSAHDHEQDRRAATEYVVAEWQQVEYVVGEPQATEDDMDWDAFWAHYAANLD